VIKPHPTDPSKAILHGLTLAKTGGIPKWGLKIMSSFLPSYMKGMQVHEARRGTRTLPRPLVTRRPLGTPPGLNAATPRPSPRSALPPLPHRILYCSPSERRHRAALQHRMKCGTA